MTSEAQGNRIAAMDYCENCGVIITAENSAQEYYAVNSAGVVGLLCDECGDKE